MAAVVNRKVIQFEKWSHFVWDKFAG